MNACVLIQMTDIKVRAGCWVLGALCLHKHGPPIISTEMARDQQHPNDEHTLAAPPKNAISPWLPVFKVCGTTSFLVLSLMLNLVAPDIHTEK